VYDIRLVAFDFPAVTLDICCGSGTYIRSIGRDLGEMLGCGAVMSELVRTRVGPFSIEHSLAPQRVTAQTLDDLLLPPATAVGHLNQYTAVPEELEHIRCGRPFISAGEFSPCDGETIAVLAPGGRLAALANYNERDRTLTAKPVFVNPSLPIVHAPDIRSS
jgi:tRNA pseudouridine55 synthase